MAKRSPIRWHARHVSERAKGGFRFERIGRLSHGIVPPPILAQFGECMAVVGTMVFAESRAPRSGRMSNRPNPHHQHFALILRQRRCRLDCWRRSSCSGGANIDSVSGRAEAASRATAAAGFAANQAQCFRRRRGRRSVPQHVLAAQKRTKASCTTSSASAGRPLSRLNRSRTMPTRPTRPIVVGTRHAILNGEFALHQQDAASRCSVYSGQESRKSY